MKTAISLDDHLLRAADQTARELGLSRSRLFAFALEEFIRRRRLHDMAERLNRVYGSGANQPEQRTGAKIKAKFRSTIQDSW